MGESAIGDFGCDRGDECTETELDTMVTGKPELLETVTGQQITQIEGDIARMKDEGAKLEREIGELG